MLTEKPGMTPIEAATNAIVHAMATRKWHMSAAIHGTTWTPTGVDDKAVVAEVIARAAVLAFLGPDDTIFETVQLAAEAAMKEPQAEGSELSFAIARRVIAALKELAK